MTFSFFNKKTKILFYGSRGWIGSLFLDYLATVKKIKIVQGSSRLENYNDVKEEIKKVRPTHVVSFTGRTHGVIDDKKIGTIDYLEYPGKLVENVQDNLYGPLNLAILCKKYKVHYTYLGTGCIFNSKDINTDEPQMFTEDSKPNYFGSGYSVVKGFTDQLMHNYPVLNLRIRMPIHSKVNDRNFITKITKYERICSINNSMTVLDEFFPIFVDLILNKKTGTFNCVNPGVIDHNTILTMYKKIVDPEFNWENMTLEEQAQILKSERSNNKLDTSKIEAAYPHLKNIKMAVEIILNKMKSDASQLV